MSYFKTRYKITTNTPQFEPFYTCNPKKISRSRHSIVRAIQTDRHTDRMMRPNTLPHRIGEW